jgi:DNA-binding NarL/FixJ family response regulator
MQLRIMLVERSTLLRSGLRRILEAGADITVVAEVSDAREAAATLAECPADVAVVSKTIDREAIRGSDIAAIRLASKINIICMCHWADSRDVDDVLGAGALGCIELCDVSEADLRSAVRLVGEGERYLSPGLSTGGAFSDPGWVTDDGRLTAREKEILVLIAQSKSNREIARDLSLSANTVAVHRNHIMRKIGVRKATALALFAAEHGLLAGR